MVKSLKIILRRFQNRKSPRKVKKVTLITVTLLFLGLISANEELDQKLNLEGYWFAIYPSSYEEAVKVVKEGRNYVATQTIGNNYIFRAGFFYRSNFISLYNHSHVFSSQCGSINQGGVFYDDSGC